MLQKREQPVQSAGSSSSSTVPSLGSAVRLTSVASLLTLLLGLATNKVIALVSGTEGVALVALFRSLTITVSTVLALDTMTVIVQRVSTAPSLAEAREVLRAAWMLFLGQMFIIGGCALFLAYPVAVLIFKAEAARHVAEVRIVLALVSGVLGMQITGALLNGRLKLKQVIFINVLTSTLTLLTLYPLLQLGRVGLAMVIGLTCCIGAMMGAFLVWREYRLTWRDLGISRREWSHLRAMPVSSLMALRAVVDSAALMSLQFVITRHYGTHNFGLYSSASMFETSIMAVLASAMTPYYLPALGRLDRQEEKDAFVNRFLSMLLALSLPIVLLLTLAAPLLIPLLFRQDFIAAAGFVPVLCVVIVAKVFTWCYLIFLQHKADYRLCLLIDSAWAAFLLAGMALCMSFGQPLRYMVWAYALSHCLLALLYVLLSALKYSRGLLGRANLLLGLMLAGGAGLYLLSGRLMVLQASFVAGALGACWVFYRVVRRETAPNAANAADRPVPAPTHAGVSSQEARLAPD